MNDELLALFEADRKERVNQPKVNTPEYKAMRARDLERRGRVMQIVTKRDLDTAEDYYYAAWIMNHGNTADDAKNAHTLPSARLSLGIDQHAGWLPRRMIAGRCIRASHKNMERITSSMDRRTVSGM